MDPEEIIRPPKSQIIKELKEWIIKNSKPRSIPQPPPVNRGPRKDLSYFAVTTERLIKIEDSKKYVKPSKDPRSWVYKMKHLVKPEALNYTPTARVEELAKPKVKVKQEIEPKIKPTALNYKASERIILLSKPLPRNILVKKKKKKKRNKSKEKVSKRVLELAKPVIHIVTGINEEPFATNPLALKYKASKRIIKMAKPRPIKLTYVDRPVVANMKMAREKYMKIKLKKKAVQFKKDKSSVKGEKVQERRK